MKTQQSSRRSFLTALATIPAVSILPAVAAPSKIDWAAFEHDLNDRWQRYGKTYQEWKTGQKSLKRWEKRHPFPTKTYASLSERIADFPRLKAAELEWKAKYEAALVRSGIGAKKRAEIKAAADLNEMIDMIALIHVATLHDLKQKAKLAKYELDGGPIRASVLMDVQNI